MQILFVCAGNTCRSPMAELYFRELCHQAGCNNIVVRSAGTGAYNGGKISNFASMVMREYGIDAGAFRSSELTKSLVEESDLIVAMSRHHYVAILQLCPQAIGKTRLLLEFTENNPVSGMGDVPDPYGGDALRYRQVFELMRPCLERLASRLTNMQ